MRRVLTKINLADHFYNGYKFKARKTINDSHWSVTRPFQETIQQNALAATATFTVEGRLSPTSRDEVRGPDGENLKSRL